MYQVAIEIYQYYVKTVDVGLCSIFSHILNQHPWEDFAPKKFSNISHTRWYLISNNIINLSCNIHEYLEILKYIWQQPAIPK